MRELDSITNSMDMNLGKVQEILKDREIGVLQSKGLQRVRHSLVTRGQQRLSYVCCTHRHCQEFSSAQ